MEAQIYRFTWEGIEIEARYTPLMWDIIAHPEIETISPKREAFHIAGTGNMNL